MEHRSSTSASPNPILCTAFCLIPRKIFRRQLCHSRACPAVLGPPLFRLPCGYHSTALLTTCPSGLLSVWPIQPQARCLISSSIGRCPLCLQTSLLLICLGHQICKMFLMLLSVDEHLQLLLQSLGSASKFQNHTRAPPSHLTQRLSEWSWLFVPWITILVSASEMPVLPIQFVPECPRQCLPSCLQCSPGM